MEVWSGESSNEMGHIAAIAMSVYCRACSSVAYQKQFILIVDSSGEHIWKWCAWWFIRKVIKNHWEKSLGASQLWTTLHHGGFGHSAPRFHLGVDEGTIQLDSEFQEWMFALCRVNWHVCTNHHKPNLTPLLISDEVLLCGHVGMCDLWLHAKMLWHDCTKWCCIEWKPPVEVHQTISYVFVPGPAL